jgi:FKBP-type peptidyl-prolyl cis-trans isomerase SlpA
MAAISAGSHVTLHYRPAVAGPSAGIDGEREILRTLDRPATLQIGAGQPGPALEQRLIGLEEGMEATFELPAGDAYGPHNPDLVRSLTRAAFDQNADPQRTYAPGDLVEISVPDAARMTRMLKAFDEAEVVIDFNHPLAGLALRMSVHVIGVS